AQLEAAAVIPLARREGGEAARSSGQPLLELLRGQVLSRAELRRALHRDAAHIAARVRALQVGIAPRQTRRLPIRVLERSGRLLRRNQRDARFLSFGLRNDGESDGKRETRERRGGERRRPEAKRTGSGGRSSARIDRPI